MLAPAMNVAEAATVTMAVEAVSTVAAAMSVVLAAAVVVYMVLVVSSHGPSHGHGGHKCVFF